MEWSKDKTMKLIEILQVNANLWNPSLCDTRRDKQKRREELRKVAEYLEISIADVTKKIQHIRSQYNREWAREARSNMENPNDRYISNWYAYEYVHFLKDSTKPYRLLQTDVGVDMNSQSDSNMSDTKAQNLTPPFKISRTDIKPDTSTIRDDFSVFGEYVANELRSLRGERNQLIAKKKILDMIFEVKMGTCERQDQLCVFPNTPPHNTNNKHSEKVFVVPLTNNNHSEKVFNVPLTNNNHSEKVFNVPLTDTQIEPLATHTNPSAGMSEIIINSSCSYSNFKVDTQ